MRLTFRADKIRVLLAAAESRWSLGLRRRFRVKDPAGFWLVGDQGVYLMHNGKATKHKQIVYAQECNPETMPFDQWWAAKRDSFGDDDGLEFIDAGLVRDAVAANSPLIFEFTETTMSVFIEKRAH
ncbi:DUF3085 domain-containing protein [Mesorhizobium sp.]|uniref:DUF3085 domain-containing protein n=2 Tax=Mesorhizobium sp. TaxID=1871066 RepID=UPI001221C367|nr:DUF3085 domain-containing protein [Mesorhizobium sp.]TIV58688.1 MAG: DUF3085 domain-containing protein [Mesorhizobium sp.]